MIKVKKLLKKIAGFSKEVVPVLLIALTVNFTYAFLCHAGDEDRMCLMNCCKKASHCNEAKEKKECCGLWASDPDKFLSSKLPLIPKPDSKAVALIPLSIPNESWVIEHQAEVIIHHNHSPPLFILKQSFLL